MLLCSSLLMLYYCVAVLFIVFTFIIIEGHDCHCMTFLSISIRSVMFSSSVLGLLIIQ